MFARKGPPAAPAAPSSPTGDVIFDSGTGDFEATVIQASMDGPVLVDFWAPWCGPCKQLTPILESAVREAKGKVRLAKVNIDENQQLAQALRVQSVPTVYAFFQGQPVTAFTGARPAGEVRALVDQLIKMAGGANAEAIDIPATLKTAAEALGKGDIAAAREFYTAVMLQDEKNVPAHVGIVRTYISEGQLELAEEFIKSLPPEITNHADFAAARTAIDVAKIAPAGDLAGLQANVTENENDHAARFDYALALFAAGQRADAIDALVEIIRRNRAWEEDKARKQILTFFEAMGFADPETLAGRRKLSAVLFS